MPWRDPKKFPRSSAKVNVYLIHFSAPLGHAQHYLGVCDLERDPYDRLHEHRNGRGAKICAAAVEAGIKLIMAKIWEGVPRYTEVRWKNQGGMRKRCPICRDRARDEREARRTT